jgi:hypothetical protein
VNQRITALLSPFPENNSTSPVCKEEILVEDSTGTLLTTDQVESHGADGE